MAQRNDVQGGQLQQPGFSGFQEMWPGAASSQGGGGGGFGWYSPGSPPGSTTPKWTPQQAPSDLYPNNIGATAPAPYQMFGNIPTIDPTYWQANGYNAAQANPFQQQQYLNEYDKMYQRGMAPFFKNQQLALNQDLAQRGIQGSAASTYNMGNLLGQQAGVIAQGEAPMVQQAFGQTQQDILANQAAIDQARQFGAQSQNEANASNAAASNQATNANAQYYYDIANQNAGLYNQYQNQLFGAGTNEQQALMAAYLNSFGPNTGVTNAFGTGMSGVMNAYSDIYGNAMNQQSQGMGGLGAMFGAFAPYMMGGA
jgi:hypothetical protein